MKLSRLLQCVICSFGFAVLLAAAQPTFGQVRLVNGQTISFPTAATEGLTLALHVDRKTLRSSSVPIFRVELCNTGRHDLLLNLGTMTSDGSRQYPSAISLLLVGPDGKPQRLAIKTSPDITGRSHNKSLVLPLPVGSSFSFPVSLNDYWIFHSNRVDSRLAPGKYLLRAQFTGPADLMDARSWDQRPRDMPISEASFDQVQSQPSGIPTSNILQFEIAR